MRKYSFYILILLKINEYMSILRYICGEFFFSFFFSKLPLFSPLKIEQYDILITFLFYI